MAGLDSNGLSILSIQEILDEIKNEMDSLSGRDVSISPDTPIGVQVTALSSQIRRLWELTQAVYDSKVRSKAEGKSLDDLGIWLNIYRNPATKTNGYITFKMLNGTTIQTGTQVQDPNLGYVVETDTTFTGSLTGCNGVVVVPESVVVGQEYKITINTVDYSYTSVFGDTSTTILQGVADAITLPTVIKTVINNTLIVQGNISTTNLSISVNPKLIVQHIFATVKATCTLEGQNTIFANTLTNLLKGISGVVSVVNREDFATGQDEESDESYRLRIGLRDITGKATVDAIIDSIKSKVIGVSEIKIVENLLDIVDGDGRPPASFETYVDGGLDQEIANVLWDTKPAGIKTVGDLTVAVTDQQGLPQSVSFSRLQSISIFVRIKYTKYSEELFPVDGEAKISNIVLSETNILKSGVDFIPQRLFGSVYSGVAGINSLLVEYSLNGSDYFSTTLPIEPYQVARTTSNKITVMEV